MVSTGITIHAHKENGQSATNEWNDTKIQKKKSDFEQQNNQRTPSKPVSKNDSNTHK